MKKIFLDLNYYTEKTKDPDLFFKKYTYTFGYLNYLPQQLEVTSFNRIKKNCSLQNKNVVYQFYKGSSLFKWQIPFKYHNVVKKRKPNYIIVHGIGYSFLTSVLNITLRSKPLILVQNNGYSYPPSGLKKMVFKWSAKYIDGFLFTGKENANEWVKAKVFPMDKVFEVMEGATDFKRNPLIEKKDQSFLWVGRLDQNKDPITILKAFNEYLSYEPEAKLTMVYSDFQLLNEVVGFLDSNLDLKTAVTRLGKIEDKEEMELLYQEHKFFVLGSHYEGSGYALMEAMACGCVPIITKIPSFNYMTDNGECALQFEPGNPKELLKMFCETKDIDFENMQGKVLDLVDRKLSPEAIARDIYDVFCSLESKKQE